MRHIALVLLIMCFILTTCGIEEYFYLPQMPENSLRSSDLYSATIVIPPISSQYYYARGYNIYYRIYISINLVSSAESESDRTQISTTLRDDYNRFNNLIDPSNTSTITNANSFNNFYILEFDSLSDLLPTSGGELNILFPTASGEYPIARFGSTETRLRRTSDLTVVEPDNYYFRNTQQLRLPIDNPNKVNSDVAISRPTNANYSYVLMYIVAVGDGANFSRTFSKPVFLGIFKLPDAN